MAERLELDSSLNEAAHAIRNADALLIGAGAGMGVDSGLPDFRGDTGFWKAYPPFRGRRFAEMSNPRWFDSDPQLAWGFFGHRYNLYKNTAPHPGFQMLLRWAERLERKFFVFTSNVDGHFQRAGFPEDRILECHGSIHYLQCASPCHSSIWAAEGLQIEVDMETIRSNTDLPKCPRCNGVARPNILMFGDAQWEASRCSQQFARYHSWLKQASGGRIVAIEFGAGHAVPTVRIECEQRGDILIRVNPHEAETPAGGISLPLCALDAIGRIDRRRQNS
ncbi:MAG TPA: Sir2 family NAD-dependent protein deacetylase [Planctomycetaceae bacterium]|jgi:NAD-dependent SIR2 family protein deacetylase